MNLFQERNSSDDIVQDLRDIYNENYKTQWLPNGDIDIYNKNIKSKDHIGFAIYFSKNDKEYAITIDTELICILIKKRIIFTNKTYWKQINHIHLEQYKGENFKENIIEVVNGYLK